MYKTIGIIGGMGPAATADLMIKITEMTDAGSDQEHIRIMIDSNITYLTGLQPYCTGARILYRQ